MPHRQIVYERKMSSSYFCTIASSCNYSLRLKIPVLKIFMAVLIICNCVTWLLWVLWVSLQHNKWIYVQPPGTRWPQMNADDVLVQKTSPGLGTLKQYYNVGGGPGSANALYSRCIGWIYVQVTVSEVKCNIFLWWKNKISKWKYSCKAPKKCPIYSKYSMWLSVSSHYQALTLT